MGYAITHKFGEMEADPPPSAIDDLISELEEPDAEHPDISIAHVRVGP
jgi:hypothetical protein